jgi:hypothetical protein
VAGALVGLLFVALSISPERLRGATASMEHQAIAATAFTALVDALFTSLIALEPGGGLREGALIFGALGLTSSCGLGLRLWRARGAQRLSRRWPILLGAIIAIYTAQLVTGLIPMSPAGQASQTTTFIYAMFGIGIARSWQLLGLHGGGPLDLLSQGLAVRREVSEHHAADATGAPGGPASQPPGAGQPG